MVKKQDNLMSGKITEATQLFAEAKKRKISVDYGVSCPSTSLCFIESTHIACIVTTPPPSCPVGSRESGGVPADESLDQRFNQYGDPIDPKSK